MVLKVFTKEDNPDLQAALDLAKSLEDEGFEVEYFDLDQPESQQLAQIFEIFVSPSFVVTEEDSREVEAWRGTIPTASDIKNFLRL